MKRFLYKLLLFSLPIILLFCIALLLPTTPRASGSLLFSEIQKDSLLKHTPTPRIIFVGSSNLSFGLNSQMILDSLSISPINTAISFQLCLSYQFNNALQYVKSGDIIVLVPEYEYFFRDFYFGSEELLRVILDVNSKKISIVNAQHVWNIVSYLPKYCISKFMPGEYMNVIESDVYGRNAFNKFGDTYTHWGLDRRPFNPLDKIEGELNQNVINGIIRFKKELENKNATLLISFPGLQDLSFKKSVDKIHAVETTLRDNGFNVISTAERYMIHDSMMFNTPYHLNKNGVDYRTSMLIQDIRKELLQANWHN